MPAHLMKTMVGTRQRRGGARMRCAAQAGRAVALAAASMLAATQACAQWPERPHAAGVQTAGMARPLSGTVPTRALLTEIADWLSANFDLPASRDHPQVELASATRLMDMRYREVAAHRRDVLALYDDKTQTIFLPETWTAAVPADLSILVHEMVHHLQNVGGIAYDCPEAREKLAYRAQKRWLARVGLDLEQKFDIDMFTIFAMSNCMR